MWKPEFYSLLEDNTNKDDPAVVDGKRSFTYGQLCDAIRSFSGKLRTIGISKGDRLAILLPNSVEFVLSYYSINFLECLVVPIDYNSALNTIEYIAKDCSLSYIITDTESAERISPNLYNSDTEIVLVENCEIIKVIKGGKENTKAVKRKENEIVQHDVSLIVYTTGTTGRKKGVLLTNSAVLEAADAIRRVMSMPEQPKELLAMPLSRSFGLARMRCVFMCRGTVILTKGLLNPAEFIKQLIDFKITGFGLVPSAVRLLLSKFSGYLNSLSKQITYIELGSAPFASFEKQSLQELMPHTDINMHYGLTESSRSTFLNFRDTSCLESVGRPTPGVEIKICDTNYKEKSNDEIGKILIRSKWTTIGYLGYNQKDFFKEGWLITDDLGKIDRNGALHFISRESEIINYQGFKFSPLEVEEVLNQHENVLNSCVVMKEDPNPSVIGFLEVNKTNSNLVSELKDTCRKNLEHYKVPSEFLIVNEIEKTDSGKIMRNKMRQKYA